MSALKPDLQKDLVRLTQHQKSASGHLCMPSHSEAIFWYLSSGASKYNSQKAQ
jgi:hypothetical protein